MVLYVTDETLLDKRESIIDPTLEGIVQFFNRLDGYRYPEFTLDHDNENGLNVVFEDERFSCQIFFPDGTGKILQDPSMPSDEEWTVDKSLALRAIQSFFDTGNLDEELTWE